MKEKIFALLKKYWHWFIVIPVAILFFCGVSSLNYFTQAYNVDGQGTDFVKWAAPDENANYVFAKLYAQTGEISFFEKYNIASGGIIKPRSFRSDDGVIKPMSFLGIIIIFGKIASVTTYKIIPFLTPLFAAIGLVYYYLLVKRLFNRNNALVSVLTLAFFPPYVYFSARSMFHNILFTVFLIIALYYGYLMAEKKKLKIGWLYAALAGAAFGLAIMARTSELLWLGPLLGLLWLMNIRRLGIIKPLMFIVCLMLAFAPALYYNQILYGSYILGGYAEMNQSIMTIKDAGTGLIAGGAVADSGLAGEMLKKVKDSIFYFGFDTYQSAKMFYFYFVEMFPWLFYPAVLGGIIFVLKWYKLKYRHLVYLAALFLVSAILVLYYGSWEFHDNPNVREHTLGNSYTRYWLPIYLGVIPLASLFFLRLTRLISWLFKWIDRKSETKFLSFQLSRPLVKFLLRAAIIVPLVILSLDFVLFGSSEGLWYLYYRQLEARIEWEKIIAATESNSVVVTQYHDKLLFPERKVIVGLFDDPNMNREYGELAQQLPVYYYNFTFPDKALAHLNRSRLPQANLQIEPVEQVTKDFTLYRLNYFETASSTATTTASALN